MDACPVFLAFEGELEGRDALRLQSKEREVERYGERGVGGERDKYEEERERER